jgi:NitT/TauT family transport system ATP-binding protein
MIELVSVGKQFGAENPVAVLDEITFGVTEGEFVTLLGPSGCGKTTLLRIVAGLVAPDRGEVRVDGRPVVGPGPERAVVFQHFALLPWMTVEENIGFGLRLRRIPRDVWIRRARELAELVGLRGFERRYPKELSGGMQQRVGLARALAVDPRLLLMDEPFAALDEQTRFLMQEELLRIWQATRKTVLFVTHSMEEALLLSDRVILLSARPGRIQKILDVPFGRPRDRAISITPEFQQLREYLWDQLRVSQPGVADEPAHA